MLGKLIDSSAEFKSYPRGDYTMRHFLRGVTFAVESSAENRRTTQNADVHRNPAVQTYKNALFPLK